MIFLSSFLSRIEKWVALFENYTCVMFFMKSFPPEEDLPLLLFFVIDFNNRSDTASTILLQLLLLLFLLVSSSSSMRLLLYRYWCYGYFFTVNIFVISLSSLVDAAPLRHKQRLDTDRSANESQPLRGKQWCDGLPLQRIDRYNLTRIWLICFITERATCVDVQ